MSNYIVHRCRLFEYTPCAIQCIVSSKTSLDIAVGRSDGSIEIWSTDYCWFQKLVIPGALNRSIESLVWMGNRLISGGLNGNIIEYDLTNATVKASVDSFGGAVWCICSSPKEEKIAAGCEDGSIKVFETKDKLIQFERAFDKQEGRILSMSWHASGDVIVTGSSDVIRVWSVKTGHAIQRITLERTMKKVDTIVWTLAILSDYTIVSGDSAGRVQFWNGKNATLLKSHQVHRADVQCLCVSDDESCVFASGVDPKVFRFKLLSGYDPTSWVVGQSEIKHTHDVRALSLRGDRLVSGGVDTSIMIKYIDGQPFKSYSFPTKNAVSFSKSSNLLLLQYSQYLDLWRSASSSSTLNTDMAPGTCVPIEEEPVKLLQIKPPSSDPNHISCSCISPCGTWLSYSTASATRLYRLHFVDGNMELKISRVRCVGLSPSYQIVFTPDSSHVILSTTNHQILVVKLGGDIDEARLLQMLPLKNVTTVTHLLSVSAQSRFLACANLNGDIDVFDISNMTHHCSVPCYKQIPTAMTFHPVRDDLIIAYDNLQVLEYSVSKLTYSEWTRHCLSSNNKPLLEMLRETYRSHGNTAVVTSISCDVSKGKDTILFMSREGLFIVDRADVSDDDSSMNARFCHKFAPLLFADFIANNTLLAVERPLWDIYDKLPPTLYQKKFGT